MLDFLDVRLSGVKLDVLLIFSVATWRLVHLVVV